jgi:hypothetical protein
MFIPCNWKSTILRQRDTVPIVYCPYAENDAKIQTRNIRVETVGNVTHICNNLPTNQGSPHKPQCTRCLHIYRRQWKTGSYT